MSPLDMEESHALIDGEGGLPPIEEQPLHEYFIIKQDVNLEVNFRERRIDGTTDIFIVIFNEKLDEVALDAAHCEVDTKNVTITELRDVNGVVTEGQKRKTAAKYDDPYKKLEHPKGWNLTAEHHDIRRMRARQLFHSRKADVPAENREFEGCTPAYGSLKVNIRRKAETDRPRLIIRKSISSLDSTPQHKQFKITIPFSNKNPRDGLHFVGVDDLDARFTHMYTRHSIQPGTASCIFPCIDDHGSRCDWKISIKFPRTLGDAQRKLTDTNGGHDRMDMDDMSEEDKVREMTVICSGFLVEERDDPKDDRKKIMTFEPEKKTSVQKLGFAVGPFEHVDLSSEFRTEEDELKLGMSALRVHAYCLPGREKDVLNTAAPLTMAADYFTYTFAKYPFSNFKICFLEDMIDETIPLHSLAFVSSRLLFPEDIIDTEVEVARKLVFTLAYQWIGINMIPNTRNDLWLVIGIASYMTELFMKRLCGNNEHRYRMKTMSDKLVNDDIDRPCLFDLGMSLHLGDFEMDFMLLKAPVVFFILDKRLFKASGSQGLTRVLQKFFTKAQIESSEKQTILDTEKFRVTCEKPTRTRLEGFWTQWVYGSGCPRFDVKAKFNKKRLCVELTLNQVQFQFQTERKVVLEKDDFLRHIKERRAETKIGDAQSLFTGPMTIRIHEADGTPYEHILEIREDATRSTKFEIPYNTKYKRLKRTRRLKEKHAGGANADGAADGADEALLYCLGDVLQTPDEQSKWELIEWDPETERKMDQESYEWIRVDADFEWAAFMKHTLEPYMYVSQLQQDRDVVAQQDAMMYLAQGPLHPIASGFLVRTLVDKRYFHGIRTMAAQALPRQANIKDLPMLGLRQLMMAYREMFCFKDTSQPHPNDFSDKQQYKVRTAIIQAIASVRDHTHRCPLEARQFILDQLLLNNNEDNLYSDHHWIATLVETLATSLIPSKKDDWLTRQNKPSEEESRFLDNALEQIERVLRRDEWTNSYQNIWTIAGLDAKQRLMKAEVIPKKNMDFGQYLLDGTADQIRIKCFEALVDLGALMDSSLFTFLLYVLSTDRSPYVRMKLIQAVSRGLAAIAFGEHTTASPTGPPADELDGLVVQDENKEIESRKEMFARRENLEAALKALRKEMDETYVAGGRHYSTAMRKALDSRGLGRAEIDSLLDLAAMMFTEASSWVVSVPLPKGWKVDRETQPLEQLSKRLMVNFKSYYKTEPKKPKLIPSPPSVAPPMTEVEEPQKPMAHPPALPRTSSIKINTHKTSLPRPAPPPPAANPPLERTPLSNGKSFSSEGTARAASPAISRKPSVTPSSGATPSSQSSAVKRPRPDKEEIVSPVAKRPKIDPHRSTPTPAISSTPAAMDGQPQKRSKIVTLKTKNPKRLAMVLGKKSPSPGLRAPLPGGPKKEPSPEGSGIKDNIPAKPHRKPLPGSGSGFVSGERKPLPGGSSMSSAPPRMKTGMSPVPSFGKASSPVIGKSGSSATATGYQGTARSPSVGSKSGSPALSSNGRPSSSAPPRPKIKIKVKPKPPAP